MASAKNHDGGKVPRKRGLSTLGQSVDRITAPSLRQRGFAEAAIVTQWDDIVGRPLCDHTRPFRVVFPRGERRGGTLHMHVSGAFATDVQHLTPQIIERINVHFGYGAIGRLELHQRRIAPVDRSGKPDDGGGKPASADAGPLAPELASVIEKVEDENLRDALDRLARTRMATVDCDEKTEKDEDGP